MLLLHQVEYVAKGCLQLKSLLDFLATHIGMLAVFEEAWTLVFAKGTWKCASTLQDDAVQSLNHHSWRKIAITLIRVDE